MRTAATSLREPEESPPHTVLGTVFRLETKDNPADLLHAVGSREVTLLSEELSGASVRVSLAPADYLAALEAHGKGGKVSVTGRLRKTGARSFELIEPSNFKAEGS